MYPNKGNNYTADRSKQTNNQYSYVKCNGLNGTDKATFWIATGSGAGHRQFSEDVSIGRQSSWYTTWYYGNRYSGDSVSLGMENYYDTSSTGYASGWVDYQ